MTDRRRWLGWALVVVTVVGAITQVSLIAASGIGLWSTAALDQAFPIITVAIVLGAVVGAVIIDRHPRHRIGWLFCVGQAGAAVGLATQAMARGVLSGAINLPLPLGHLAAWFARLFGGSYALTLIGCLLLLVPDGRLRNRRWRWALGLLVGGYAVVVIGLLQVSPSKLGLNGPAGVAPIATILEFVGSVATTLGVVAGAVALVVRLRTARGEERQQLRWIGAAAFGLALTLLLMVADGLLSGGGPDHWFFSVLFYLGYLAVPLATGFAVLRYRLYQIDVIIGSAVRLAALGAFVTAGYIAIVILVTPVISGALGSTAAFGSAAEQWPSLFAFVAVAAGFQPLRRLVKQLADRVVYGERAAPYDSLAEFGRQLGASVGEADLLLAAARSCALAMGVRAAVVTVTVPDGDDLSQRWPAAGDGSVGDTVVGVAVEVHHQSETVGGIELLVTPGQSVSRADRRLLAELADRAGPAFRNVALAAALGGRAQTLAEQGRELAASRRRLASAANAERQQVAESIRTDVVRHLHDLPMELVDLERLVQADPAATAARLLELQRSTTAAIEALRTITGGVLPPLLSRRGLAAALQSFADRSASGPAIVSDPESRGRRFEPTIEVAAYFCCVWAAGLLDARATITVRSTDRCLLVQISGHAPDSRLGDGGPAEQLVVDRIEAAGGQLELGPGDVEESGGRRVDIRVTLPVAATVRAQSSVSESGPKADLSR